MTDYEVYFETFDYIFKKEHIKKYDYIKADSEEDAIKRAHYIHGSLIDIIWAIEAE